MYYICEIYPLKQTFIVNEHQLDSVVSELDSNEIYLLIKSYASEEELPEAYIQLKPRC